MLVRIISPNPPFLSLDLFPEHKILEENFDTIKDGLDQLTSKEFNLKELGEIAPLAQSISSKKWRSFFVKCYRGVTPLSQTHMPRTSQLINECKSIKLAMFSVLKPGAKIPPHIGTSKLYDQVRIVL